MELFFAGNDDVACNFQLLHQPSSSPPPFTGKNSFVTTSFEPSILRISKLKVKTSSTRVEHESSSFALLLEPSALTIEEFDVPDSTI
jgi:hypothetical protein